MKNADKFCPSCGADVKLVEKRKTSEINPKYIHYQKLFSLRDCFEDDRTYAIRIETCARKFERLPEVDQTFIRAAKSDGLSWRGDDMEFFRKVYDEHMKMKSMTVAEKRAYQMEAFKTLYGKPKDEAA